MAACYNFWMGDPAQSRQYFLAIDGQQSGPFLEEEILQQWHGGRITAEALLWYEGLENWKPVGELLPAIAKTDNTGEASVKLSLGSYSDRQSKELFSTFASSEEGLNPVFDDLDSGASGSFFLKFRIHVFLATIIVFGFLAAGGLYLYTLVMGPNTATIEVAPVVGKKLNRRDVDYRKAVSDILLDSQKSIATFSRLVKENPNDEIGKMALEAAIDFYRRSQRHIEIGRILMEAQKPSEAIQYFFGEHPSYPEAFEALGAVFKATRNPDLLLQQIDLLLGPLNDRSRAIEFIRSFEKEFPKKLHPFGYYLKSDDEQIVDLFSRISFYFVQSMMNFLEAELPQVHLLKRPLVELKRDKDGNYRIVGSYVGDVTLSRDPLKDIHMTFWLSDDRWVMVDTNLTRERARWSAGEKKKLTRDTWTSSQMLRALEQRFRTQFSKSKLHEVVKPADAAPRRRRGNRP